MPLVQKPFGDIITFTRASSATFFDSAGVLQSAANNVPRLDYNPATLAARGLLIEEQRTNSIRNNTMQDAVAGTPGTLPTNWASFGSTSGLTQEIVGIGTENGISYIDLRYSGTTSATITSGTFTRFESNTQISASSGQVWAASQYIRLVNGSISNITSVQTALFERSAAGSFLDATTLNITTLLTNNSLSNQRFVTTRTLNNALTTFVSSAILFTVASGVAIDITLRIGLPQLELGAFATSVIPTTTTALTRSADVASVNTLSPWFNATEGTIFVDFANRQAGIQPYLTMLSNTGETNRIYQRYVSGQYLTFARVAGVDIAGVYNITEGSAANAKIASAYNASQLATSTNGRAVTGPAVASLASVPSGLNKLWLGTFAGLGMFANGYLRRITYYPRRLSNAELQSITS